MAQFSFTMAAADVNTIKGNTGNSDTEIVADRLSAQSAHRVRLHRFGDGYEQRVLDGINTKDDKFSVSFNNRGAEEIALIAGFFDQERERILIL